MDGKICVWPNCRKWLTHHQKKNTTSENLTISENEKEKNMSEKILPAVVQLLILGWYVLGSIAIAKALN